MTKTKRSGRKAKTPDEKVTARGVYLNGKEWKQIVKKFGTPTKAMREGALAKCG